MRAEISIKINIAIAKAQKAVKTIMPLVAESTMDNLFFMTPPLSYLKYLSIQIAQSNLAFTGHLYPAASVASI